MFTKIVLLMPSENNVLQDIAKFTQQVMSKNKHIVHAYFKEGQLTQTLQKYAKNRTLVIVSGVTPKQFAEISTSELGKQPHCQIIQADLENCEHKAKLNLLLDVDNEILRENEIIHIDDIKLPLYSFMKDLLQDVTFHMHKKEMTQKYLLSFEKNQLVLSRYLKKHEINPPLKEFTRDMMRLLNPILGDAYPGLKSLTENDIEISNEIGRRQVLKLKIHPELIATRYSEKNKQKANLQEIFDKTLKSLREYSKLANRGQYVKEDGTNIKTASESLIAMIPAISQQLIDLNSSDIWEATHLVIIDDLMSELLILQEKLEHLAKIYNERCKLVSELKLLREKKEAPEKIIAICKKLKSKKFDGMARNREKSIEVFDYVIAEAQKLAETLKVKTPEPQAIPTKPKVVVAPAAFFDPTKLLHTTLASIEENIAELKYHTESFEQNEAQSDILNILNHFRKMNELKISPDAQKKAEALYLELENTLKDYVALKQTMTPVEDKALENAFEKKLDLINQLIKSPQKTSMQDYLFLNVQIAEINLIFEKIMLDAIASHQVNTFEKIKHRHGQLKTMMEDFNNKKFNLKGSCGMDDEPNGRETLRGSNYSIPVLN